MFSYNGDWLILGLGATYIRDFMVSGVFCCLILVDFTHIIKDYFNGTSAAGLPAVREKSGNFLFFKVREKSGNSVKSLEKSLNTGKSRKSQGILWWLLAILFFITVLHLYVPNFSAPYGPRWKNICIFFMLCHIFPPIRVSREENVCAGHSLLTYWGWDMTYYFVSQINFHLHYHEAKITYYVLKNFVSIFAEQLWKLILVFNIHLSW